MLKFITSLFATTTKPAGTPTLKTRLGVDVLETREAPAVLVLDPGTIRGFNPQPDPPGSRVGIIAIDPGARGIIIEGG